MLSESKDDGATFEKGEVLILIVMEHALGVVAKGVIVKGDGMS